MSFCRQEVLFALLDRDIVSLQGKRVCLFTHYTIMCIFDVVFILEALCLCVSSVGAGTVMDGKHTPILQPLWPCSLTPYSYIFFFLLLHSTHCIFLPHHADRHTHAHAPTAPVAPPRLLRVEQGDPGPMRQAARRGGNQGRTCPGSAFWSSSRQGDRSAVTPALEETAPSSGGGDGPPSFALR